MEAMKKPLCFFFFLFFFFTLLLLSFEADAKPSSILFATMERSNYYFDVYSLPTKASRISAADELKITDSRSINFNGYFPTKSSVFLSLLPDHKAAHAPVHLIYISERNGSSGIYLDALYYGVSDHQVRVQVPLVGPGQSKSPSVGMKDRPNLVGDHLVYVSTHEDPGTPRTSWAAVYSTHLKTGSTKRLTPHGLADFSPSVSPSGVWTAVASFGEKGWGGEAEELNTSIYLFKTDDGSGRVKVVERGGWPCWADDSTLYYHRKSDDGWWSIYSATLPKKGPINVDTTVIRRLTPSGLHAFTPATSVADKGIIAVATRHANSSYRHIELFDIVSRKFTELTRPIAPTTHHYNPFLSPDGTQVGYHRCRAGDSNNKADHLFLENRRSPLPGVSLHRIDGYFPALAPGGRRLTYALWPTNAGLYVINRDGSGLKQLFFGEFRYKIPFGTVWDPKRKGVVYISVGVIFGETEERVDIVSLNVDDNKLTFKNLTFNGKNNGFAATSPDGKRIVFRSGKSGYKNLYIMDAEKGEDGGLFRLTEGPWADTMPNWSPDGKWIVFSSDRDRPGSGSFAIYMIRPDGTGLKKFFNSGTSGRVNHPWFSPDMKSVVFVSDYGAVSAEPISYPQNSQPFGDVYTIKLDGTGLQRLTHSAYEDGTPTWTSTYLPPVDVKHPVSAQCLFQDLAWLTPPANSTVQAGAAATSSSKPVMAQCAQ